jgi:hypothetical protein
MIVTPVEADRPVLDELLSADALCHSLQRLHPGGERRVLLLQAPPVFCHELPTFAEPLALLVYKWHETTLAQGSSAAEISNW